LLFWTVIFFLISLTLLIKGNIFYNSSIRIGEIAIQNYQDIKDGKIANKELVSETIKLIFPMLIFAILALCEFIYFINAISVDIYKYPSISIILLFVLSMILKYKPAKKIEDIGIDEYRKNIYKTKKRSLSSFIYSLIYMTYFSYMFWILVFLK